MEGTFYVDPMSLSQMSAMGTSNEAAGIFRQGCLQNPRKPRILRECGDEDIGSNSTDDFEMGNDEELPVGERPSRNSFYSWTDRRLQADGSTSASNRFMHEEQRKELGIYLGNLRLSSSSGNSFKATVRQKRNSLGEDASAATPGLRRLLGSLRGRLLGDA